MGFDNATAQARMLHRSIAYDGRFNSLTITEQWLYMRMLPFVDDEGKITGNITELQLMTIPSHNLSDSKINNLLAGIKDIGLILWEPGVVIQYTGWKKNQKIYHRPKKSKFPDPDINTGAPKSIATLTQIDKVLKGEESIVEEKKRYTKIEDIGKEELSVLLVEFPDIDVQKAFEGFKDYLLSSGKKYKNYLAALRNQCRSGWAPKYDTGTKGNGVEYTLECPECKYQHKTDDKRMYMSCPKCRGKGIEQPQTMAIV